MMNLKQYPDSCIDAYIDAVNKKEDQILKTRLNNIEDAIRTSYDSFDTAQLNNNLDTLTHNSDLDDYNDDLQGLYLYKSKVIRSIKDGIKNAQIHKIITTCQNCTIESVDSLDHILGQTAFPEYAVNAHNLFPSCTTCNRYKGDRFTDNGHRKFLNLYLDTLPEQQYLFVNITNSNRGLDFEYHVENRNNIDRNIFQIIHNHYNFLHLPKRMKDKASEGYVSELETTIKNYLEDLPLERIISKSIKNAQLNMIAYGYNHFRYILEIALLQNTGFLDRFTR